MPVVQSPLPGWLWWVVTRTTSTEPPPEGICQRACQPAGVLSTVTSSPLLCFLPQVHACTGSAESLWGQLFLLRPLCPGHTCTHSTCSPSPITKAQPRCRLTQKGVEGRTSCLCGMFSGIPQDLPQASEVGATGCGLSRRPAAAESLSAKVSSGIHP